MEKRYTEIVSPVLGFGLVASMVAGCSAKSSENVVTTTAPITAKAETAVSAKSGGSAAEQKRMVFWDKLEYVEDYNTIVEAKVDEFVSENHVDVDCVVIPAAGMKQRLMAAIKAGNVPDLIVGDDTLVGQFISMRQIAEYSDIFEVMDPMENSKMLGTSSDKSYLMPLAFTAPDMYLRTDQWGKIGMDIPTTWEELKGGAKLMNDPVDGFYGLGFAMGTPGEGDVKGFCRTIILDWGGTPVDESGKATVNFPETPEAPRFIASLHEEGLIPPDAITGDDSWNNNARLAGITGAITNSGPVTSSMKEEKPDLLANTQITAYPAGPTGETFTLGGANVFGIFEIGEDTEIAKELVRYHFEDLDNYNTMIEAMGAMWRPVVNGVDDTDFWKDPVSARWLANSKNTYKTYYPVPSGKGATVPSTNQLYVKAIQKIVVNKVDPQETLDHLEAELNKIYN